MPTLDDKIDFRCTKKQKKAYKAMGGAKVLRAKLDENDEIILQKNGKLFKKVSEK